MDANSYVDVFATKGIEYLFVILFFIALVPFWLRLNKPAASTPAEDRLGSLVPATNWFKTRADAFFHPGHGWAAWADSRSVKVGMDDFAQALLGEPARIELPAVGTVLREGEPGWHLLVDSKRLGMLSPLSGEVIEVNEAVLKSPELVNQDPFGKGWLLRLKDPGMTEQLASLYSPERAAQWMAEVVESLRLNTAGTPGLAMQDGGTPIAGFARHISPDSWETVAAGYLLTGKAGTR